MSESQKRSYGEERQTHYKEKQYRQWKGINKSIQNNFSKAVR